MASQELRAFLSCIDRRYVDHANTIHQGEFTNQAELAAAHRTDLEKLGIPKGAAGLIIAAARGTGDDNVDEQAGPSKKARTGPSFRSSSLQAELLEALRVFHSDESLHFVASDTSFSKLRGALQDAGWLVDLTGVVPEHPQRLETPRPAQFQWGNHESMHMAEAVEWLNQHVCPTGVLALRAESCSWLKAAFGCIHLDLHKTDVVFVLEESKREFDLDSLTENLMLMMLPFIVGLFELKTTNNLTKRLSRSQAQGMVESLAINSMLKKQARHVRVYMGDLNTSYSFASVNRNLFMTSQGSGDDQVVAMVEWIKSKLSDNAKVARANLATNRLPESMHTDDPSATSSSGDRQLGNADRSSDLCPAFTAPSEPKYQQAETHGNGSDAEVGDQASEANFAADLRTLARTPAFYKLLGLQEPPQCITHPFLEDFANRRVRL